MLGAAIVAIAVPAVAQTDPQPVPHVATASTNAGTFVIADVLPDSPGVLFSSSEEQTQAKPQDVPKDASAAQAGKDVPKDASAAQKGKDASAGQDSMADEQKKQYEAPKDQPNEPVQTPRILGIVPNFQSVTADKILPPETVRQKFTIAGKNSFDYSSFLLAGIQAGFAQDSNSYPEFRQGAIGYFRYYWHTLADTADENFMVGGAGPALFHEDSRFYTLGHGSFLHRAGYASSRIFITRNDHGNETVNFAEIVGAGAAAGVSSLYYPTRYQTWTKVGQKWLTSALIDSANFTFKEFWPSINHKLFHEH